MCTSCLHCHVIVVNLFNHFVAHVSIVNNSKKKDFDVNLNYKSSFLE